jgi:hypothetical protein
MLTNKLQQLQWTPYVVYIYAYMQCNSHATICNFFATNLSRTFQCGKQNANVVFHPFVNEWCVLIPFATYLQLFSTSLTNIIFNYFIHPFDVNRFYPNPLQLIYNYFITSLMNIFFNYFIHPFDVNRFYPNPLQLIYNYFITSLMNIFFNYFIHSFEQWIMFMSFVINLQQKMKWK